MKGAGGGVKHESHGRGSEDSSAGQARQRDRQATLKNNAGLRADAVAKATAELEKLKMTMKEKDFKLILGKLTEEQWIGKKARQILGR